MTIVVLHVAGCPVRHLYARCCARCGRGGAVHVVTKSLVRGKRFSHAILCHRRHIDKAGKGRLGLVGLRSGQVRSGQVRSGQGQGQGQASQAMQGSPIITFTMCEVLLFESCDFQMPSMFRFLHRLCENRIQRMDTVFQRRFLL